MSKDKIVIDAKDNSFLFKRISIYEVTKSSHVIVPETYNAIIIKDGIALETLPSGKHYIANKKKSSYYSINDLIDAELSVIFISKTVKLKIYWGTASQWEMRDPICGAPIKLGASGEFEVQVSNPRKAYLELIGEKETFNVDDLKDRLQGRLLAQVQFCLSNIMNTMKISYDRLCEVLLPISAKILPEIKKMFEDDYGLQIFSFTISDIIISQQDIDKVSQLKQNQASAREKEKIAQKEYERHLEYKKMEIEDYENYLKTVAKVGWPNSKVKNSDQKECPNCNAVLKGENKYCPVCGYELVKQKIKCPNCSKLINKSDTFCKHCGAKVG